MKKDFSDNPPAPVDLSGHTPMMHRAVSLGKAGA